MEGQLELELAVDALSVSAHVQEHGRWTVTTSWRRHGSEQWSRARYEFLTTDEMVDVVSSFVDAL